MHALPPQTLCLASLPANARASSPSPCSRLSFLRAQHSLLVLPKGSRKATIPFKITSFADPHHLTTIESYSYKNRGRGGATVSQPDPPMPFSIPRLLTPIESAVTKNAPVTLLECAVSKRRT